MMKPVVALLALALCCSAAQRHATIPPGSAIYVDSKNGFDKFLTAAFQAKRVPLRIVSSPEEADYTLDMAGVRAWDVVELDIYGWDTMVGRTSEGGVRLTSKSGDVACTYVIPPRILKRGGQSVAEAFAKYIKGVVAKGSRP